MRPRRSRSVRAVAFATVFCALGIAAGCGRETFDLLSNESLTNAGGGAVGANLAGNSGASGKTSIGGAGKGDSGGSGGRFVLPGGNGGTPNCLGDGGCADESGPCVPGDPLCTNCTPNGTAGVGGGRTRNECALMDANICDPELKRCVQCRKDSQCNVPGSPTEYHCNLRTYRCAKACSQGNDNCSSDPQRLVCNKELGLCVSCLKQEDCNSYGQRCYLNECFDCYENSQCVSQLCVFGHCVPPH
jgi:hypothetical protein